MKLSDMSPRSSRPSNRFVEWIPSPTVTKIVAVSMAALLFLTSTLMERGIDDELSTPSALSGMFASTLGGGSAASARSGGSDGPIVEIRLLGERNTGTNWITAVLDECFPSVKSKPKLIRWKHWFQDDDGLDHPRTLVIAMFRNPYEWIAAMQAKPHHAPSHFKRPWKKFVTIPWTFPRPPSDLAFANSTGRTCQEKFEYRDIVACQRKPPDVPKIGYSGTKPIYEMRHDGSGEPYNNILELRAAKIHNFLSVNQWPWIADDLIVVQYEELLGKGTQFLLDEIERLVGVKPVCDAQPPQPNRKKRKLDQGLVDYLTKHMDWEAEKLIGYSKGYN